MTTDLPKEATEAAMDGYIAVGAEIEGLDPDEVRAAFVEDAETAEALRSGLRAAIAAALPFLPQYVKPSVEDVARAIDGAGQPPTVRALAAAHRVLALLPGPTVASVREQALREARVHPEFEPGSLHDDEYEYVATSDCDGSNKAYHRRKPRYVGDYHPWEPTTQEDFYRAAARAAEEARRGE